MGYAFRLFIVFFFFCGTSGCSRGGNAQEQRNARVDVVRVIDGIGHIATAGVVFIPPGISPITTLPSDRLMNEGCDFKTSDSRLIAELILMLRRVEFKSGAHAAEWDKRQAIYFRSDSGAEVRLVFGRTSGGYWASIERLDTGDLQSLTLDPSIEERIYHWAAGVPQTPRPNGMSMDCKEAAR